VGYMKPPKETRYKKGQSGHPEGRPIKVDEPLDPGSIVQAIESETTTFELDNGKPKRMTKGEAHIRQMFRTAIAGDMKIAKLLMEMAETYFAPEAIVSYRIRPMSESEALRRFGKNWRQKIDKRNAPFVRARAT